MEGGVDAADGGGGEARPAAPPGADPAPLQQGAVQLPQVGRRELGELLLPGVSVLVEPAAEGSSRKTRYSLICVKKDGQWVNIDSQAPNKLAEEWIAGGGLLRDVTLIKREQKYGNSRFDLYVEAAGEQWFIEVRPRSVGKSMWRNW